MFDVMGDDARTRKVADLLREKILEIGDGYRAKNSELSATGLPFARAGSIDNGVNFQDAEHFPADALPRVGNKTSQAGDRVFTSKGTVGRFAYVSKDVPRLVYSPQLCFWRTLDGEEIDGRFPHYWMQSPEFLEQVDACKSQTDMADSRLEQGGF